MDIIFLLYFVAVFIGSIILHEVAHGWMALRFNDSTAKDAGRLTLNPIPHIDPIGSILLPGFLILMSVFSGGAGFIIGWAKPVPINPLRYSDFRAGTFFVSIAGVAVNFLIALSAGLAIRFFAQSDFIPILSLLLFPFVWANIILGFLNLLPIPPLDGSKVLSSILGLSMQQQMKLERFGAMFFLFVIFMLFWNPALLSSAIRGVGAVFSFITGIPL